MKKLLIAMTAAATLSACGLAAQINAALQGGNLDAAKVSATGYTLAKNLSEIQSLSGGLNGLVPSLGQQGGGLGFAPALRMAPRLAAAQPTTFDCSSYSGFPRVVTYSETKETFAPEAEESKTVESIEIYCKSTGLVGTAFASHVEATYKDASTATATAVELDAADGTTGKDLSKGLVQLNMNRYFAETDERKSLAIELKLDFLGTWEEPNAVSYGKIAIVMRNGTEVTAEIKPDAPLATGDEFTSGTATRTTIYGEGNLKSTTETATVTAKDTGSYHVVNEYKDGTKDDYLVTADGNKLTLDAKGHDGFARTGSLQLASGEYSLVTTFPQGHPFKTVTESGVWHKSATQGTYNRTIEWIDAHVTETKVTANVNNNTLSATFTHDDNISDDTESQISGKLDITQTPSRTSLDLEASNAAGDKATLSGVKYADGSATLHYTKDLKATAVNPDEEGDFTFNADGSGSGTVKVTDGTVSKTVTVTVSADGTSAAQ